MAHDPANHPSSEIAAEDSGLSAPTPLINRLLTLQGVYYLSTGVWSLVDIASFQKVTGPKTDLWLVKTVGVLVSAIGGALMIAGARRQRGPEIPLLAIGSAAGLAAIDVVYVAKKRISPVYLLDAVAEVGLAGLLASASKRAKSE